MLKSKKQRNSQGFTIIEVLIVLAIAGLILLIVFLAVPALQRNARNTSLKSDASAVIAAINEFENNNSGQVPTSITAASGTVTVSGANGTTASTGKVQGATVVNTGTADPNASNTITVVLGKKCNGNVLGSASSRSVAALYDLETASSLAPQCLEG
jgi:prepilin-type N-terminal cleavage/methylation domain-containing protein